MTKMKSKTYRDIEKIFKGVSNHRRVQIIDYVSEYPGVSILDISMGLDTDFRGVSKHVQVLERSGLLSKHFEGRTVHTEVTPLGKKVLTFARTLE